MPWSARFEDPIILPDGRKLLTLKGAREWLDEKEHGEDRAYKAEQLKLQCRADLKSTIALVVAGLALIVSAFAALWRH